MQLDLNDRELEVLRRAVSAELGAMLNEVAHTEAHDLQHALARDIEALERLLARLEPPPMPAARA